MDLNNITKNAYDVLYKKILGALGIDNLQEEGYNLSEAGFLRLVDLNNSNVAISNNNLYYLCNDTPSMNASYVPSGDLISSYSIFLNSLVPIKSNQNSTQVPSITEAMGAVSFLTGARNISSSTIYNMPVNTNPPIGSNRYLPYYKLIGLKELMPIWENNQEQKIFPYTINVLEAIQNAGLTSLEEQCQLELISNEMKASQGASTKPLVFSVYSIEAKFSGLGNLQVRPINWFFPSFFRNKQYTLRSNAPNFFEENGSLETVVTSLLLGYNLDVKIVLSEESFTNFSNTVRTINKETNASLSVDRLKFNISGSNKDTQIKKVVGENTVHLTPVAIHLPNLLGVITKKTKPFINGTGTFFDS